MRFGCGAVWGSDRMGISHGRGGLQPAAWSEQFKQLGLPHLLASPLPDVGVPSDRDLLEPSPARS
jgi:hypothetical protein